MEAVKTITELQLKTIKDGQSELNKILLSIGAAESPKHAMLHQLVVINESVEKFKKELENEYGAITINIEDGSYTIISEKE